MSFLISPETRAKYRPEAGYFNVSMDFNAAPSGSARGTEVIIPDNAPPEVRAAAERFNAGVADFARRNGIADYPIRGVRTRSENGRGVPHTIHAEPFFNSDMDLQRAIQNDPAGFASIYRDAFGGLSNARLIAPHGVGNDRGAASDIFGNETSFGQLMANTLLGGDVPAADPVIATSGVAGDRPMSHGPNGQFGDIYGGDGGDTLGAPQAAPQSSGMPVGLLEVPEMEQERRLLGGLLSEDQRDRLIMGLEGMTLNPNRALMASAGQAIQGRQEARKETKAKQEQAKRVNRTIEWLSQQGRDDLASAVSAGGLPAGDAVRIAMTPQEQAKPTAAIQNYEYARQQGYQGSFDDFQNSGSGQSITPYTDAGKAARDYQNGLISREEYEAAISGGNAPDVKGESDVRKEFQGLQTVKEFDKQASAFGRIRASAQDPSPAGDLALIFNYMKLLDPGSVVREGEFATAQNAAGVDTRARNLYNQVLEGTRLSEEQRRDFVGRAETIYQDAEQRYSQTERQYRGIADQYGYDPRRSVPNMRASGQYAPQTSIRPGASNPGSAGGGKPQYSQDQIQGAIDQLSSEQLMQLSGLPDPQSQLRFLIEKGVLQ